jgi:hypothetical protein
MDKNKKDSDAHGPHEGFHPAMGQSLPAIHLLIRAISKIIPHFSRRCHWCVLIPYVLSLLLAFVPGETGLRGQSSDFVKLETAPVFSLAFAPQGRPVAAITPSGKVLIAGGTVVPLFPRAGKWTEIAENTSDRYESRHFVYMVPGESPAIELFVTRDRKAEPPDGTFEMGLVKGFLSGFAANAGFKFNNVVFRDRMLGPSKIKHTLVKLTSNRGTLWVHAYIYPRKASLTFIAIRAQDGAQADIEKYLAAIELK